MLECIKYSGIDYYVYAFRLVLLMGLKFVNTNVKLHDVDVLVLYLTIFCIA